MMASALTRDERGWERPPDDAGVVTWGHDIHTAVSGLGSGTTTINTHAFGEALSSGGRRRLLQLAAGVDHALALVHVGRL